MIKIDMIYIRYCGKKDLTIFNLKTKKIICYSTSVIRSNVRREGEARGSLNSSLI